MQTTKRLLRAIEMAAGVIGVAVAMVATPDGWVARSARKLGKRLARDLRYAAASTPGIRYRLSGRHPDPHVSDDILADRIRSALGPLEHRLDVPRVHVIVDDHIAILHGEIPDERSATAVERAVLQVVGVRGIESHLHLGLTGGDTRPSEGHRHHPRSAALQALVDAARGTGAHHPESAVHAVLCGFTDRIPDDERAQIFTHLPADVRRLAEPPRRRGERASRVKTVSQLVAAITAERGIEPEHAEAITRAVITTLRGLVPEEVRDIAAVLPGEIKEYWTAEKAQQR
jgi:uncharacterized protein (DUF2267 family)